jgi:predicted metal-dependent hydrolase
MNELPVEIVRSDRRKRTLQASIVDGAIRVRVPAGLSQDEERVLVDRLVARVRRKTTSHSVDLRQRARALARRFGLPEPAQISWSDRQNTRWGSCTPANGTIRISNRVAVMPEFVLDYVVLHELAHLEVPGHGDDFQAIVGRYEFTERARGYLMAISQSGAT